MIKLQFKLPQALIGRGFTRRTVFNAPAFQQKGINRLMDISIYTQTYNKKSTNTGKSPTLYTPGMGVG